jgi:hypothetical protein
MTGSIRRFDWPLWGRWVLANALGEAVGLGGSLLLVGGAMMAFDETPGIGVVILIAAMQVLLGAFLEGVTVGTAQWWVLRRPLPALRWRTWALATALGAGVAWLMGIIPSTLFAFGEAAAETAASAPAPEIPDAVQYLLAAGLGLAAGPILGFGQWIVLRRRIERAGWWIVGNALGWMAAMPLTFVAPGLLPAGPIPWWAVPLLIGTVLLAGAVVGVIHGVALVLLLRRPRTRPA